MIFQTPCLLIIIHLFMQKHLLNAFSVPRTLLETDDTNKNKTVFALSFFLHYPYYFFVELHLHLQFCLFI